MPTDQNPADLLTRGSSINKFKDLLQFWTYGPEWLKTADSDWPVNKLNCLSEANKKTIQTNVAIDNDQFRGSKVECIPTKSFSNYGKSLKGTELVFRFIKIKCKVNIALVQSAITYLVKTMQAECFPKEISFLNSPGNRNIPDLVKDLNLYIDEEGVIRSKGRINKNVTHEEGVQNSILLGKSHHLTYLLIIHFHHRVKHLGVGTTLNALRLGGFWVPKGRQVIKKVLSHYMICREMNGLPFKYPKVTNLPKHRVNLIVPYRHTGVDFTGHLWVENYGQRRKMYIIIFTCLNTRAVHLDLIPDMSTHSFVSALLRFSNKFGIPSHIYSDNARSFLKGCDVISEVFSCSQFLEHFQTYNIKHVTIPVYSPWVGSTW